MDITRDQIRQAFKKHGTDKLWLHGYDSMYFNVFSKLDGLNSLAEIGVKRGRSISAWLELFPETKIYGIDIDLSIANKEKLEKATLIEASSIDKKILDVFPESVDVIIDDGSHHVNDQWVTYYHLKDRFKKAYVIEDIIGIDNEKLLRARFKKHGFKNRITSYLSRKQDAVYRMGGKDVVIAFYGMVIEPVV